jgi:predicted AlkP superfamily pyrophosphatase or phosphodiesterase
MQKRLWIVSVLLTACLSSNIAHAEEVEPTVILISLDAFRWDYAERAATPALDSIAASGIRAKGLIPVFPSKTFPNHYSMATGLYPENHGIISNVIYDPEFDAVFTLRNREEVGNSRWWGGEPIWVTAAKQGIKSATLFWPGSEAAVQGIRPTHWRQMDASMSYESRVDQILEWLDLPEKQRPRFLTLYIEEINKIGHLYGPNSPEVIQAVEQVDRIVGRLLSGLKERNLNRSVNLVVVSDHGMAEMDESRVVFLDDFINLDHCRVLQAGAILQLIPKPGQEDQIFTKLEHASPHMKIYRRADLPERLNLKNNSRVTPLVGIPDDGWTIATRSVEGSMQPQFRRGDHGQDPKLLSMHGIFYASGPALKKGILVDRFENVHIYNLLASLLEIRAAPNDGDPSIIEPLLVN